MQDRRQRSRQASEFTRDITWKNFHIVKEPNKHERFSYGRNSVSEKKHIFFPKNN